MREQHTCAHVHNTLHTRAIVSSDKVQSKADISVTGAATSALAPSTTRDNQYLKGKLILSLFLASMPACRATMAALFLPSVTTDSVSE